MHRPAPNAADSSDSGETVLDRSAGKPDQNVDKQAAANVDHAPALKLLFVRELPGIGVVVGFVEDLKILRHVLNRETGQDGLVKVLRGKTFRDLDYQALLCEGSLDDNALLHD
jgi:hypothetical protein